MRQRTGMRISAKARSAFLRLCTGSYIIRTLPTCRRYWRRVDQRSGWSEEILRSVPRGDRTAEREIYCIKGCWVFPKICYTCLYTGEESPAMIPENCSVCCTFAVLSDICVSWSDCEGLLYTGIIQSRRKRKKEKTDETMHNHTRRRNMHSSMVTHATDQ